MCGSFWEKVSQKPKRCLSFVSVRQDRRLFPPFKVTRVRELYCRGVVEKIYTEKPVYHVSQSYYFTINVPQSVKKVSPEEGKPGKVTTKVTKMKEVTDGEIRTKIYLRKGDQEHHQV